MTPQQAKELLPIITAFANGETIQFRRWGSASEKDWENISRPSFCEENEYRIKPKTKTIKAIVNTYYSLEHGFVFTSVNNVVINDNVVLLGTAEYEVEVQVND